MTTTEVARKKRAPTKKKVYDWSELCDLLANPPKQPTGEVAERVRAMAAHSFGREKWVHLSERLVIVASETCIRMAFAHTPPGTSVSNTNWSARVEVRPAAGGRTTYSFDTSVNGWFANRHLPINARDRGMRSSYRHNLYYYGQSGVYQRGFGPWYPDVGPDIANAGLEEFCELIRAGARKGEGAADEDFVRPSPEWCELATSFCEKVRDVVRPFKDCIVRFEEYGDAFGYSRDLNLSLSRGSSYCQVRSDYGVRIRVKLPNSYEDGRPSEVPDFTAVITGPLGLCEKDRNAWYTAQLLHPQGRHCTSEYSEHLQVSTGLEHLLYRTPGEVIEAARQWAANHIYIPC